MNQITCKTCRNYSMCMERTRWYPCKDYQIRQEDKHTVLDEIINVALSISIVVATYYFFSALALIERGYRAFGGECLVAVVVGGITYCFLKGGNKHGILS